MCPQQFPGGMQIVAGDRFEHGQMLAHERIALGHRRRTAEHVLVEGQDAARALQALQQVQVRATPQQLHVKVVPRVSSTLALTSG